TGGFTRPPSDWGRAFGFLTATDPVIATEFGVLQDFACTTAYDAQLIAYLDDPPASPPRPLGPGVNFTFGHGPQGWAFDLYDAPDLQNLAVHPPAGVAPPALTFNATDGAPEPGSLQVSVHFTAFNQHVDPDVNFFFP